MIWGPTMLQTVSAQLTGDVTMTSSGTFYDGPSVSLTPGRWVISASIHMLNGQAAGQDHTIKIWDSTTVFVSGSGSLAGNSDGQISVTSPEVTVTETKTVKVSAGAKGAGSTILAATANLSQGNTASTIMAIKLES